MPLETATTINQLVVTNPTGADPVANADDHIRTIKATLKNTFPNITAPVTATAADINAGLVFTGIIAMWSGAVAAIPTSWLLCNGLNGTPDLRDRFVVGAGGVYPVGTTGGANTATASSTVITTALAGSHSHSGTTQPHALTVAQMPSHTHSGPVGLTAPYVSNTGVGDGNIDESVVNGATDRNGVNGVLGSTGGGEAHSHAISADGSHTHAIDAHTHTLDTRSPYYALCFIMKG